MKFKPIFGNNTIRRQAMHLSDKDTILFNSIYVPREELEAPVFAYVRFLKDGMIGFSVQDSIELRPDFSSCGVFWLLPEDFLNFFEPLSFPNDTSVSEAQVRYPS